MGDWKEIAIPVPFNKSHSHIRISKLASNNIYVCTLYLPISQTCSKLNTEAAGPTLGQSVVYEFIDKFIYPKYGRFAVLNSWNCMFLTLAICRQK